MDVVDNEGAEVLVKSRNTTVTITVITHHSMTKHNSFYSTLIITVGILSAGILCKRSLKHICLNVYKLLIVLAPQTTEIKNILGEGVLRLQTLVRRLRVKN